MEMRDRVLPANPITAEDMEIKLVTNGNLVWPSIGWDVLSLYGVMPSPT